MTHRVIQLRILKHARMSCMRSCGVFPTESRGSESLSTTLPSLKIAPTKNWGRLRQQQLPLRVPRRVPDGFQFFPTTKKGQKPEHKFIFVNNFPPPAQLFFFSSCLPDAKYILSLVCRAGTNACRCQVIRGAWIRGRLSCIVVEPRFVCVGI